MFLQNKNEEDRSGSIESYPWAGIRIADDAVSFWVRLNCGLGEEVGRWEMRRAEEGSRRERPLA